MPLGDLTVVEFQTLQQTAKLTLRQKVGLKALKHFIKCSHLPVKLGLPKNPLEIFWD